MGCWTRMLTTAAIDSNRLCRCRRACNQAKRANVSIRLYCVVFLRKTTITSSPSNCLATPRLGLASSNRGNSFPYTPCTLSPSPTTLISYRQRAKATKVRTSYRATVRPLHSVTPPPKGRKNSCRVNLLFWRNRCGSKSPAWFPNASGARRLGRWGMRITVPGFSTFPPRDTGCFTSRVLALVEHVRTVSSNVAFRRGASWISRVRTISVNAAGSFESVFSIARMAGAISSISASARVGRANTCARSQNAAVWTLVFTLFRC